MLHFAAAKLDRREDILTRTRLNECDIGMYIAEWVRMKRYDGESKTETIYSTRIRIAELQKVGGCLHELRAHYFHLYRTVLQPQMYIFSTCCACSFRKNGCCSNEYFCFRQLLQWETLRWGRCINCSFDSDCFDCTRIIIVLISIHSKKDNIEMGTNFRMLIINLFSCSVMVIKKIDSVSDMNLLLLHLNHIYFSTFLTWVIYWCRWEMWQNTLVHYRTVWFFWVLSM